MIWIMLPAYNEEKSLPSLIKKIHEIQKKENFQFKILIINDGSTDNTENIAKSLVNNKRLKIINHIFNRGLGETERTGFEYVALNAKDNDFLIRMDCDDTHEPKYIPLLFRKAQEGFDVVNTSRFAKGGSQLGLNNYRRIISILANLFMKIVFNIKGIKDFSCGYRIYRVSIIKKAINTFGNDFLQLKGLGFTSTLETIIKLKILGCSFSEIPFTLRYDQKISSSKMVASITTLGYLVMAVLYWWPFGGWRKKYKNLKVI